MKRFILPAVVLLMALCAPMAQADYTGQTIDGTLAFGPNGSFGGQFWSPASITDPGSFFYEDGANIDTAVFTGTTLTITDQVIDTANGWEMTFSDPAMPFGTLSLVSTNFAPALTDFTVAGGVITVDWAGTGANGVTYTATFDIGPTATPEPGSLMLVGTGLIGLVGLRRRKIQA